MASSKQIRANRANALKSTGPNTNKGKAVSSKNSLKHGLLTTETLLPWESSAELDQMKTQYLTALNPEGELELALVNRIISLAWRLKRAGRIETGIFALKRYSLNYGLTQNLGPQDGPQQEMIHHLNTVHDIENRSDLSDLAFIFSENSNSFSNLQRYEAGLEKSLYRALHELQRLQCAKNGNNVPPPIAIDVTGGNEGSDVES